uniref:Uncharacterized protein n=1 Tax=Opuntia streptacantha TaxID=393608 RepID=A0A7C8YLS7_OPUST
MAMSSVIPYEQFDCEDQRENLTENENAKIEEFDCEDEQEILAGDENGRKLWSKVKYQLLEYHALPPFLQDNEYILGYYRSEWPLKQVLLSIFTIHNETLNVWTDSEESRLAHHPIKACQVHSFLIEHPRFW